MKARSLVLLFLCFATMPVANAQSTFGGIVGVTQDASLAVVPGATISLRNLDENTTHATISDGEGNFQFLNLKPGRYEISAKQMGFADFKINEVLLGARQTLRINIKFEIASIGEAIQVTTTTPAINTENGTISDTKNFQEVTQLPVNYRGSTTSPLAAINTVPGVQQDSGGNVSIGGGTPAMIQFSVDGISTVNVRSNGALLNLNPSSELIREFKVTAFNNNAEFSQVGDVTISTKSGSNDWHGSLFEYHQNSALDATVYGFDSKAPKVFHTFGGSLGGPVSIPKLYQGKDKTFFFFAYESNRRRVSTPQQFSVPTAEMRQGNLAGLSGGDVLDPLTGSPFPNHQIPADRISSVSARLLEKYYPLPNFGSGADTNANARRLAPTPASTNGYDVRIDHSIGSKQQIYGRWSWKNLSSTVPNVLLPSELNREFNRNFIVSHNYSITPNLINEFRFGVSRSNLQVKFPIRGASAIADLGLVGLDISNHPNTNAFPTFNFSDGTGFTPIGRDKTGVTRSSTFQYTDNLTWVKNKHTMKFGLDIRRLSYFDLESFGGSNDFGAFTFTAGNFTGNAFADFLLGLPATTYVARSGPDIDARVTQYGFYAQDEWRINKRLTLNFGLRWQLLPPFTEKNGNITVFDKTDGGVIIPGKSEPTPGFLTSINACPGVNPDLPCAPIRTARQAGLGPGLRHTYYRNFQPRLSFAYRPFENGKTVIRGGFGLFTMTNLGQLSFNITDIHVSDLRTYVNTLGPGGIPAYQFPRIGSVDRPIDIAGTGEFYQNVPIDYRDPQSAQWNLTVEREFPGNLALRVSYVGMNSYRMNNTVDLNQVAPSTQPYSPDRKPYRNWGRILSSENLGFANYQALQTELSRRFSSGLSFQSSYTWAKNLGNLSGDAPTGFSQEVLYGTAVSDGFNLRANRGNIAGTRRHRFLLSGIYQLPVGKSRPFLKNLNPVANALLGDWELSTVTLVQSGPFLTPMISPNFEQANLNIVQRGSVLRPDRVGNGNLSHPTPDRYFDINAFMPTPAGAGRIGNAGVGILTGPGTVAVAMGLAKQIMITEKVKLRLEVTFTNLPNHPNFATPAVDVSTPATFGKTTSVQSAENAGNRTGQVALRLEF